MNGLSLKERQRQVREEAILDAAQELMVEQSYAEMSMDDLAARVGVSKATLYQHFASKEDLAINVIVRAMRRGEEQISAVDASKPAIARLADVVRNGICGRAAMGSAQIMLPPTSILHHPLYRAQRERMTAAMSRLVDEAKQTGDIDPRFSTDLVVHLLMSAVREASHGELVDSGTHSLVELGDALVAMLFDGIRAKRSDAMTGSAGGTTCL